MNAIAPGLPPSSMFHGPSDRVVPFETSLEFSRKMKKKKNPCELVVTKVRGTGFLSISNVSFQLYQGTLNIMERLPRGAGLHRAHPEGAMEVCSAGVS